MLESETFRRSVVLDSVNVNAEALRHGYINNSDKALVRDLSAQECKLLYQTLLEDIAHMNMLDPDLYDYQNSRLDITLEDDEKTFSARLNPQCTRTPGPPAGVGSDRLSRGSLQRHGGGGCGGYHSIFRRHTQYRHRLTPKPRPPGGAFSSPVLLFLPLLCLFTEKNRTKYPKFILSSY